MDNNSMVSILVAIVSSSALTALINYISNFNKNKAETKKLEQDVVSDKIDQASIIVETAMKLLEDVQGERDRLLREREELVKINNTLLKEVERLKLCINKYEAQQDDN
jgi:biopolymer transport protein ExbB/TolQ